MFYVCLCIYGVLKSKIIDNEIENSIMTYIDVFMVYYKTKLEY